MDMWTFLRLMSYYNRLINQGLLHGAMLITLAKELFFFLFHASFCLVLCRLSLSFRCPFSFLKIHEIIAYFRQFFVF